MKSRNLIIAFVSFFVFLGIKELTFRPIYSSLVDWINSGLLAYIITYLLMGVPLFIGAFLVYENMRNTLKRIGIISNAPHGLLFAFLCTLPMGIGYAFIFDINPEFTLQKLFMGAFCAALFEELYYRGIFFGMLFRKTRLGFIPAIITGAMLFAAAHLYQSDDLGTMVQIFMATLMGAGWFAWVFSEWRFNLWVPTGLHFFMNAYWMLFGAGDNAAGGFTANIFRITTIALVILGTLWYKKRKNQPLIVNRSSLWLKHYNL